MVSFHLFSCSAKSTFKEDAVLLVAHQRHYELCENQKNGFKTTSILGKPFFQCKKLILKNIHKKRNTPKTNLSPEHHKPGSASACFTPKPQIRVSQCFFHPFTLNQGQQVRVSLVHHKPGSESACFTRTPNPSFRKKVHV